MSLLARIVLAVVVAVLVTLGCILVGGVLSDLEVKIAVTIGNFLSKYASVFGILAGLWFFFAGSASWTPPWNRNTP